MPRPTGAPGGVQAHASQLRARPVLQLGKVGVHEASRGCKYGYPFAASEATRFNDSGYPMY